MQRLPVFAIVRDAYRFLWDNRRDFVSLAYLMIVVNSFMQVLIQLSLPEGWGATNVEPGALFAGASGPLLLVAFVIGMVLYIMFAVAWHRLYLVGAEPTTVWGALRWRSRHWRYVVKGVLVFAIAMATLFAIAFAASIVGGVTSSSQGSGAPGAGPGILAIVIAVGLIAAMFLMRFMLAFPASAVDDEATGLAGSWRLTRGNGWTLLLVMFLVSLPIGLAAQLVQLALLETVGLEAITGSLVLTLIVSLINQSFSFAGIAVTTSALSIAYQDLHATRPPSAGTV